MEIHDVLFGFEVLNAQASEEVGGTLWTMRHQRTGARLAWLENGEDNKLFSVAFKTIPWDDTGVFHILEHSVLGGSDAFPVKEPFLDLLKGSMNTFLNAITFPDKTMYPVSSRNARDFLNLTRVYLDAVFCPAIYRNPNIFYQEGWHYELRGAADAPAFKGVVFNEMKGAYSSVDEQMDTRLKRMLFPDTCYGFDSGGDPARIPDLTYERFLDAHREFYHPGNAYIYLDGAVPLGETLSLIDGYLSRFEPGKKAREIAWQQPVAACCEEAEYEIGQEEDEAGKTHIAASHIIADWRDRKKQLALDILCEYLCGSNDAPVKRAVLETGLAQDVRMEADGERAQTCFTLQFRNTERGHGPALFAAARGAAEALLEKGLDKEELAAALDQLEFTLRETDEPRGVMRAILMLNSWLYGGDPMQYLAHDGVLAELRAALDTDYYENLVREMLLDAAHTATLYMLPSKTRGAEQQKAEEDRLVRAAASWSAEEKAALVRQNAALDAWQQQPDPPEATATIPTLALSDIGEEPEWTDTVESMEGAARVLLHPVQTGGVSHASLYFDLADQDADSLRSLAFAARLLGELPTRRHTVSELQKRMRQCLGRVRFEVSARPLPDRTDACLPQLCVSFSALTRKLEQAAELIREILLETRFDDAARVRELLLQAKEADAQRIVTGGVGYAIRRARAQREAAAALEEQIAGFDFYRWMCAFADGFDAAFPAFSEFAGAAFERLCAGARLTLSQTAPQARPALLALARAFKAGEAPARKALTMPLPETPVREAIRIPAGIAYAVAADELLRLGRPFDGALQVMGQILTFGYLWGEIRVQGGAYSCGFSASETGRVAFNSYRDPNPMNSLGVYARTADFIRAFCASDEALEKYIISSISGSEPLRSPAQKGASADGAWFGGVTLADRRRVRAQMLGLKKEELLSLCALFDDMAAGCAVCVIGGEGTLGDTDGWRVISL